MLKYTIITVFIVLGGLLPVDLRAQTITLTENQRVTVKSQVSDLVDNYETGLNNLGDSRDGVREKEYFVTDILQRIFEDENVLVLNDLDPENRESRSLKAKIYLNNIVTKYSKGAVFAFSEKKIHGPYLLNSNHIFLKVTLKRTLRGTHIDQTVSNTQPLDMYVSLKIEEGNIVGSPRMYSITGHEDNIRKFTPVEIRTVGETPSVAINIPNENSVFVRGKIYPIKWEGPPGAVKINLYKDGKFLQVLSDYATDNMYYWEVSDLARPGKYYNISISYNGNADHGAISESFTIRRKIPLVYKILPMVGIAAAVIYYVTSGAAEQGNPIQGGLPLPPNPPD